MRNRGTSLCDLVLGSIFLDRTPKTVTKEKINWALLKLKTFVHQRTQSEKRTHRMGEKCWQVMDLIRDPEYIKNSTIQ